MTLAVEEDELLHILQIVFFGGVTKMFAADHWRTDSMKGDCCLGGGFMVARMYIFSTIQMVDGDSD